MSRLMPPPLLHHSSANHRGAWNTLCIHVRKDREQRIWPGESLSGRSKKKWSDNVRKWCLPRSFPCSFASYRQQAANFQKKKTSSWVRAGAVRQGCWHLGPGRTASRRQSRSLWHPVLIRASPILLDCADSLKKNKNNPLKQTGCTDSEHRRCHQR